MPKYPFRGFQYTMGKYITHVGPRVFGDLGRTAIYFQGAGEH